MIQAKVVADSTTATGDRLTTLEVVMPRYILAEFNTHRMLTKSSASSRAIPFNKMAKEVEIRPFIPYAWQKEHKGMQGNEYFTEMEDIKSAEGEWLKAKNLAIMKATTLNKIGVTKQLCNRVLEPFMYHKVLVSGTEWENFFNLRCPEYVTGYKLGSPESKDEKTHKSWKDVVKYLDNTGNLSREALQAVIDKPILEKLQTNKGQADIHMMFLAEAIYDAKKESIPNKLQEGEWHIPYGDNIDYTKLGIVTAEYYINNPNEEVDINKWVARISIARCARLSYQTLGDNPVIDYVKDLQLYEILNNSGHWSPFEHVAKAMSKKEYNAYTKTSLETDKEKDYYVGNKVEKGWCRNYRGFIQYRELVD
jgi:thymidylate synthase ThyX